MIFAQICIDRSKRKHCEVTEKDFIFFNRIPNENMTFSTCHLFQEFQELKHSELWKVVSTWNMYKELYNIPYHYENISLETK